MPDNISKHNATLTSSERSAQASRAGVESGRSRRARAKLIELSKSPSVLAYLDERLDDKTITAIADAVIRAAVRGNMNAVRYILSLDDDLSDDKPEEVSIEIRFIDDEEV